MKKLFLGVLVLFFISNISFAQNKQAKWTFGFGASLVNFGETGLNSVGDQFLFQVPKISFSRYIVPSITLDVSTSISTFSRLDGFFDNNFNYFSIDGTLRYDFGTYKENLVPYIGIGVGWIGAPSTIPNSKATPTTNFVGGGTFWFAPRWGLHAEFVYKLSSDEYESMRSHSQVSAGLVYSFKPRQMVRRLWNR